MSISKRKLAFMRIEFMDSDWHVEVVPVAGNGGWAVSARRDDRYTGRPLYGQIFAIYTYRLWAERLSDELNAEHQRRLTLQHQATA